MERLSDFGVEDLCQWLTENSIPSEVCDAFRDNEMDGEALVTLIGVTPGPDCLKELVGKVGLRLKVYKAIKSLYDKDVVESTPCFSPSPAARSTCSPSLFSGSNSDEQGTSTTMSCPKTSRPKIERKSLPDLFPIPVFRPTTEEHLANEDLTESDRKYMVQTLTTVLMTYIQRPSQKDCLFVSKALHSKLLRFLGNESSEMAQEFGLVMERPDIKEEFDEQLELWCKAVITYCKKTQVQSTAIQRVIREADFECIETLVKTALRCLCLLLMPVKKKEIDGDIPFVMRYVPNGTPPAEAPDKANNQPHVVVIEGDEYSQYFIAIEQIMMLDSTDITTALFHLMASHYVFNLSYHSKATDFYIFLQERVAQIPSVMTGSKKARKKKSPVSVSHINGIARIYDSTKDPDASYDSMDNST